MEKIVAGGFGLGRHRGQVVFVREAAPGDRLMVEPVEVRRDFLQARAVALLEASPLRRDPPCPFYARCGGCSMMHISPQGQAEAKREIVLESLRRGGGLNFEGRVPTRTGQEMGYRVRARLHVKLTRRGPVVGFKARASNRVEDIDRCLQISEEANRVLSRVRQWLAARPERASGIEAFEILEPSEPVVHDVGPTGGEKQGAETGRAVLHFIVKGERGPRREEYEELVRGSLAGLVVSEGEVGGSSRRVIRIGEASVMHRTSGFTFRASAGSFFQANRFLLDALVEEVVPAGQERLGRAIDLYCGVGLFTLPLASLADEVWAIETSARSLTDARANARRAGLNNITFLKEDASAYAAGQSFEAFDLVVADPPRGGLAPPVVAALSRTPPREIRYVSCDPAALGRDAGHLVRSGLVLSSLVVLDLFPNTHHVEVVATFRRRSDV